MTVEVAIEARLAAFRFAKNWDNSSALPWLFSGLDGGVLKGETFSSAVGVTPRLSVFFTGTGGCFFPLVRYFSGLIGTGGGTDGSSSTREVFWPK